MKTSIITFVILAAWATGACAWIDSIHVEPFKPAPGDSVTVTVYGTMPNSCWSVVDHHGYGAGGQEINIDIDTYDFGGRPLDHCLMVLKRYQVVCRYRLPTAGPYTVTATEHCDSLNPCSGGTASGTFDTRGPRRKDFDAEPATWEALKSCYR